MLDGGTLLRVEVGDEVEHPGPRGRGGRLGLGGREAEVVEEGGHRAASLGAGADAAPPGQEAQPTTAARTWVPDA